MKIVFYAPNFYPMIGGLESVVLSLATGLSQLGHRVLVITQTPRPQHDTFPFAVARQPTTWRTAVYIYQNDVFVQFNMSLKGLLPWLLTGRPLVATHHGLYSRNRLTGQLKWLATRLATINTGCSHFISQHHRNGQWLPNPYNDAVFRQRPGTDRQNRLVFLGRLVAEKGIDVLLRALQTLKQTTALVPELTIIGSGPLRNWLGQLATALGVEEQVVFVGDRTGEELAITLHQHTVLIVPSVYDEPFGIVALEGIACGCFVIGTQTGGLPEAIGPCGVTFPVGNAAALTSLIAKALAQPAWRSAHLTHAATHLAPHTRAAVTGQFMHLLSTQL